LGRIRIVNAALVPSPIDRDKERGQSLRTLCASQPGRAGRETTEDRARHRDSGTCAGRWSGRRRARHQETLDRKPGSSAR
jgi:hypothetical protein